MVTAPEKFHFETFEEGNSAVSVRRIHQKLQLFLSRLAENGRYWRILPQEGIYISQAVPGLALQTAWLWQDPLPTMRQVGQFWEARASA